MTTIREIEKAIVQLPKHDLAQLRNWFEQFDARMWDEQFEEDARSGRLDSLASQAIADYHAGKCKDL